MTDTLSSENNKTTKDLNKNHSRAFSQDFATFSTTTLRINTKIKEITSIDERLFPIINNMNNTCTVLNKTKSLIKTGTKYKKFMKEYSNIIVKPSYKLPDIHSYPLLKNLEYVSLNKQDYYRSFNTYDKENENYNLQELDFKFMLEKLIPKRKRLKTINRSTIENNIKNDSSRKVSVNADYCNNSRDYGNININNLHSNTNTNTNSMYNTKTNYNKIKLLSNRKNTDKRSTFNLKRKKTYSNVDLEYKEFYEKNHDLLVTMNIPTEVFFDEALTKGRVNNINNKKDHNNEKTRNTNTLYIDNISNKDDNKNNISSSNKQINKLDNSSLNESFNSLNKYPHINKDNNLDDNIAKSKLPEKEYYSFIHYKIKSLLSNYIENYTCYKEVNLEGNTNSILSELNSFTPVSVESNKIGYEDLNFLTLRLESVRIQVIEIKKTEHIRKLLNEDNEDVIDEETTSEEEEVINEDVVNNKNYKKISNSKFNLNFEDTNSELNNNNNINNKSNQSLNRKKTKIIIDELLPFDIIPLIESLNITELKYFVSQILSIKYYKQKKKIKTINNNNNNINKETDLNAQPRGTAPTISFFEAMKQNEKNKDYKIKEDMRIDLNRTLGYLSQNTTIIHRLENYIKNLSLNNKQDLEGEKKEFRENNIFNSGLFRTNTRSEISYNCNTKKKNDNVDNDKTNKLFNIDKEFSPLMLPQNKSFYLDVITNDKIYRVCMIFPKIKLFIHLKQLMIVKDIENSFCIELLQDNMLNWELKTKMQLLRNKSCRNELRNLCSIVKEMNKDSRNSTYNGFDAFSSFNINNNMKKNSKTQGKNKSKNSFLFSNVNKYSKNSNNNNNKNNNKSNELDLKSITKQFVLHNKNNTLSKLLKNPSVIKGLNFSEYRNLLENYYQKINIASYELKEDNQQELEYYFAICKKPKEESISEISNNYLTKNTSQFREEKIDKNYNEIFDVNENPNPTQNILFMTLTSYALTIKKKIHNSYFDKNIGFKDSKKKLIYNKNSNNNNIGALSSINNTINKIMSNRELDVVNTISQRINSPSKFNLHINKNNNDVNSITKKSILKLSNRGSSVIDINKAGLNNNINNEFVIKERTFIFNIEQLKMIEKIKVNSPLEIIFYKLLESDKKLSLPNFNYLNLDKAGKIFHMIFSNKPSYEERSDLLSTYTNFKRKTNNRDDLIRNSVNYTNTNNANNYKKIDLTKNNKKNGNNKDMNSNRKLTANKNESNTKGIFNSPIKEDKLAKSNINFYKNNNNSNNSYINNSINSNSNANNKNSLVSMHINPNQLKNFNFGKREFTYKENQQNKENNDINDNMRNKNKNNKSSASIDNSYLLEDKNNIYNRFSKSVQARKQFVDNLRKKRIPNQVISLNPTINHSILNNENKKENISNSIINDNSNLGKLEMDYKVPKLMSINIDYNYIKAPEKNDYSVDEVAIHKNSFKNIDSLSKHHHNVSGSNKKISLTTNKDFNKDNNYSISVNNNNEIDELNSSLKIKRKNSLDGNLMRKKSTKLNFLYREEISSDDDELNDSHNSYFSKIKNPYKMQYNQNREKDIFVNENFLRQLSNLEINDWAFGVQKNILNLEMEKNIFKLGGDKNNKFNFKEHFTNKINKEKMKKAEIQMKKKEEEE